MKKRIFANLIILSFMMTAILLGCLSPAASAAKNTSGAAVQLTQAMLDSKVEEPVGQKGQFKGITIGFSQRNLAGSEWYENLIRVAKMEAQYLGVKLVVLDAQSNLSKQVSDIENLVSQNVDAIILIPRIPPVFCRQ